MKASLPVPGVIRTLPAEVDTLSVPAPPVTLSLPSRMAVALSGPRLTALPVLSVVSVLLVMAVSVSWPVPVSVSEVLRSVAAFDYLAQRGPKGGRSMGGGDRSGDRPSSR